MKNTKGFKQFIFMHLQLTLTCSSIQMVGSLINGNETSYRQHIIYFITS